MEEQSPFYLKDIYGSEKKENTESISQINDDKNKNDGIKSIDNKLSNIYIDDEIINIQIKTNEDAKESDFEEGKSPQLGQNTE